MNVGELYKSKSFGSFVVVEILDSKNVMIIFVDTGFLTWATKDNIVNGRVKDKLKPTVYGVGFIGDGKYTAKERSYSIWHSMIARCYGGNDKAYFDCTVCDEWHDYQNFARWFEHHAKSKDLQIDKDIKVKGNRIYSPENCLMVTKSENIKAKVYRDENNKNGYAGIVQSKYKDKIYYGARVTVNGKRKRIGSFSTAKEAHDARVKYLDDMRERSPLVFENAGL